VQVLWEGLPLEMSASAGTERNTTLALPATWPTGARRTLKISYEIVSAQEGPRALRFTNEAFFLPAADWSPEILPSDALFGFGGTPPRKWELKVRVPQGFLVHTSGANVKTSRSHGEQVVRALQTPADHYPFVVAGRYSASEVGASAQRIILWTRSKPASDL